MKAFQLLQTLGSFVVLVVMIIVWGVPIAPTLVFYEWATDSFTSTNTWVQALITGISLSTSFIIYCLALLTFSALLQFILHVRIKEKTVVPLSSMKTIRWAFCTQILRATQPVLQHFVPSFIGTAYYRTCGAKIGKNSQITTFRLNDPSLIQIGDDCVIGGSAVFNGHLVEKGQMVFAPIIMKSGSLVGAGCMIQPGVIVGENAVLASQALVPKYREIPANEVWGGLPATMIRTSSVREEIDE